MEKIVGPDRAAPVMEERPSGFAAQAESPNRRGEAPLGSRAGRRPRKRPACQRAR